MKGFLSGLLTFVAYLVVVLCFAAIISIIVAVVWYNWQVVLTLTCAIVIVSLLCKLIGWAFYKVFA